MMNDEILLQDRLSSSFVVISHHSSVLRFVISRHWGGHPAAMRDIARRRQRSAAVAPSGGRASAAAPD
jgi:hypothetical protein